MYVRDQNNNQQPWNGTDNVFIGSIKIVAHESILLNLQIFKCFYLQLDMLRSASFCRPR